MSVHYAANNRALKSALWLIDSALAATRPHRRLVDTAPFERILVCNQAHLGDAILSTSVIPALQAAFPQARLGFLVHPEARQVVDQHPDIDWVHPFEHWHLNRRDWSLLARLQRHVRSARACVRSIRAVDYDLAIDLYHYFPNSIPLLRRAGVRRTLGWSSGGFGPLLDVAAHDDGSPLNVLDRHARLLALAGLCFDLTALRPCLGVTDEMRRRWQELAAAHCIAGRFVALHLGAHAPHRRWPTERWSEVAQMLLQRGHGVVLFGHGRAEIDMCGEIKRANPAVVDLSGRLSWHELVTAIEACALLVAHDSAPIHLAAGLDRPRICIAAGINDLRIWLRSGQNSAVLMKPVPCAPCLRTGGCATMACIRGVTPASVLGAAGAMLGPTTLTAAASGNRR